MRKLLSLVLALLAVLGLPRQFVHRHVLCCSGDGLSTGITDVRKLMLQGHLAGST